jgi:hypothetical protein
VLVFGEDGFFVGAFLAGFFDVIFEGVEFFGVADFVVFFGDTFLTGGDFLTGFFVAERGADTVTLFAATFFLGAAFFFGEDFTIEKIKKYSDRVCIITPFQAFFDDKMII